jgi:aspartyl aminopeptidase
VIPYNWNSCGWLSVGAAGPILGDAVKSITSALHNEEAYEATIRKSFVLSSDQSHALHPNYASKHEKNHQPQMNAGMVIKRNSNQRYATNGVTGVIIREIARRASLPPVQEFIVKQDCGCGSTIGPLISTATGIRAIDMGCPQLSMHSIREQMGICDRKYCYGSRRRCQSVCSILLFLTMPSSTRQPMPSPVTYICHRT